MNKEFIKKMRQANQLQREAIVSLLPDAMRDHLQVIRSEMKAMAGDLVKETAKKEMEYYQETSVVNGETKGKSVNKVNIQ